jgi:hypothetical protein
MSTMKGMCVRNGWLIVVLSILLGIGLVSCDSRRLPGPIDPVDKFLWGVVTDDLGNPLPDVSVTIYSEFRTIGGDEYEASLVTDEEGRWGETVTTSGNQTYSIVYSRSGLIDLIQTVFVMFIPPDSIDAGSVALPPIEFTDVYRIVLTWGNFPPDLDAHLTGPRGNNERFHVYWKDREAYTIDGEPLAKLISDRRSGYGPETIALKKLIPGTYRFTVHNYSRNEVEGDTTLAASSNAMVRVFGRNGIEHEFSISGDTAPAETIGNLWRVLEIDGETGQVTFINEMFDGVGFDDETILRIDRKPDNLIIP